MMIKKAEIIIRLERMGADRESKPISSHNAPAVPHTQRLSSGTLVYPEARLLNQVAGSK